MTHETLQVDLCMKIVLSTNTGFERMRRPVLSICTGLRNSQYGNAFELYSPVCGGSTLNPTISPYKPHTESTLNHQSVCLRPHLLRAVFIQTLIDYNKFSKYNLNPERWIDRLSPIPSHPLPSSHFQLKPSYLVDNTVGEELGEGDDDADTQIVGKRGKYKKKEPKEAKQ
jgi:hypothetical protein